MCTTMKKKKTTGGGGGGGGAGLKLFSVAHPPLILRRRRRQRGPPPVAPISSDSARKSTRCGSRRGTGGARLQAMQETGHVWAVLEQAEVQRKQDDEERAAAMASRRIVWDNSRVPSSKRTEERRGRLPRSCGDAA